jgi:hypothetical protein
MQLEEEANVRMGAAGGGGGGGGGGSGSRAPESEGHDRVRTSGSSNGSGGYRYAAMEQAMDASASGKRSISSQLCNVPAGVHACLFSTARTAAAQPAAMREPSNNKR